MGELLLEWIPSCWPFVEGTSAVNKTHFLGAAEVGADALAMVTAASQQDWQVEEENAGWEE